VPFEPSVAPPCLNNQQPRSSRVVQIGISSFAPCDGLEAAGELNDLSIVEIEPRDSPIRPRPLRFSFDGRALLARRLHDAKALGISD